SGTVGTRDLSEITQYSAQFSSYFSSPRQNWLWGWTANIATTELHLFPGLLAAILAAVALVRRPGRLEWVYAAVFVVAVDLSFGLHGLLYSWLYAHLWVLQGLRAPSRFAILALAALSVLAGLGFLVLDEALGRRRNGRLMLLVGVICVLVVEYGS